MINICSGSVTLPVPSQQSVASTLLSIPPPRQSRPAPLGSGVYTQPPGIYHTIHSLEHAAVIIWYRPGTQSAQLTAIQTYLQQQHGFNPHRTSDFTA